MALRSDCHRDTFCSRFHLSRFARHLSNRQGNHEARGLRSWGRSGVVLGQPVGAWFLGQAVGAWVLEEQPVGSPLFAGSTV